MPTITKISQQVKKHHRYSVFVDGKFSFSLSELETSLSGLRVGNELTESELADYLKQSGASKAVEKAYNFLSYRARSRREIEDYLRKKQYDEDISTAVLGRLESEKLVNDTQFAEDWAEERQKLQHRSKRQLSSELFKKGVSRDDIEASMVNLEDEVETIVRLITTRRLISKYDDERKLIAYLAGKGFNYGDIKTALQRFE